MSILVTGAAGFIGSRLCLALLQRGDSVVGVDNFDPYYPRSQKERVLRQLLDFPQFQFAELDVRDADALLSLFQKHEIQSVAHIAAMAAVRYSVANPLVYAGVNVGGTANLLDAARRTSKPNCVLASTGGVYGSDTPVPFDEDAPAVHPLAPYPASKRAMELLAHSFAHSYELPITVARLFNVYGPHGRPDMMPWQWCQKIARGEPLTLYDGGDLKRDWTFIDDVSRALLLALDCPFDWQIVNFGGGSPVSNARFVSLLEPLVGRQAQIVNAPTPNSEPLETWANIEKAARLFGWRPEIGVEEGLARFVEWMREVGELSLESE